VTPGSSMESRLSAILMFQVDFFCFSVAMSANLMLLANQLSFCINVADEVHVDDAIREVSYYSSFIVP
jgi:hypothetical protein